MTLLNRQLYARDPKKNQLANNGVAQVGLPEDAGTAEREKYDATLRFELANFVCEGQYKFGLELALSTYLDRIRSGAAPAPIWISGFFGAGKSHLSKMMSALWDDHVFADGASAASVATHLPQSVKDLLKELKIEAKKHGGTHVVAGMLGSDASAGVLAAVLGLVFKSVDLPSSVSQGRFVLWLKEASYYDRVKAHVESAKKNFTSEIRNMLVSQPIAEGLLKCDPSFGDIQKIRGYLRDSFKNDIQVNDELFRQDVTRALTLGRPFPLTLIVLDEVQQFIGTDGGRTLAIQQVAELCQSSFNGKVLLVATGQSAMGGTEQLEKLRGRFPLTVHLTDSDVEGVIRKTILEKSMTHVGALKSALDKAAGEISRHLNGTRIAASASDEDDLVPDYPILPARRRFFESVLKAVDASGVISQLRNQLRIAYQAALETADLPVGNVVGGDFIFNELQSSSSFPNLISNELFTRIRRFDGSANARHQLKGRLLKLIFLINKLPTDANFDLGLRASADTLADLLVTDLVAGSANLRAEIPALLAELENSDRVVMGYEENGKRIYREQTAESAEWYSDFTTSQQALRSSGVVVEAKRGELMRDAVLEALGKVKAQQGVLNTPRKVHASFDDVLPANHGEQLTVWVQDGWLGTENNVLASAKAAGPDSSTIFLFIPDRDKSDLHDAIVEMKSAEQTLQARGLPQTAPGKDARKMMEGKKESAELRIDTIITRALADAKVFSGGGAELDADTLGEKLRAAVNQSLPRLYPHYSKADNKEWSKVLEKSREGVADAIKLVGHTGDPDKHPVCAELIAYIGTAGKKGADIQERYEGAYYGWPRDAIQGALMALLANNVLKAKDAQGTGLTAKQLDRNQITKTFFQTEQDKVSVSDRIAARSVLKKAGIECNSGEESVKVGLLGAALHQMRMSAGGDPPLPALPDHALIASVESTSGNAQVLEISQRKTELERAIEDWKALATSIKAKLPGWNQLTTLLAHAEGLDGADLLRAEALAIETNRALLQNPNPVATLLQKVTDALRQALNGAVTGYTAEFSRLYTVLSSDDSWTRLDESKQSALLATNGLDGTAKADTASSESIITELARCDLNRWQDRIAALAGRFEAVHKAAAKLVEPEAVAVTLPRRILKSAPEVKAWLTEVEVQLLEAVKTHPVQL